jgi:hypothetical protein
VEKLQVDLKEPQDRFPEKEIQQRKKLKLIEYEAKRRNLELT